MEKMELDAKHLLPMIKYIEILVENYPDPLRANELAEKTGHSKAAISKIRNKLIQLCDSNKFAFEKGFVLSENSSLFPQLFIVFLANGKHRKFLASKFFKAFVNPKKIHTQLITLFPSYNDRFSVDDTKFLIKKLIQSVEKLPEKDFQGLLKLLSAKKPSNILQYKFLDDFRGIISKLQFSYNNKNEFLKTIELRDKFFFLIRDYLWAQIEQMRILKKLDQTNKENYKKIYKQTIDFYLRIVFEELNLSLMKSGKLFFKENVESKVKIGASHLVIDYNQ